jgi:HEAT repeat protein
LIDALDDDSPDVRVIAVEALAKLGAKEALPRLRGLLTDTERSHFGALLSVAEAAKVAIAQLQRATGGSRRP